MSAVRTKYERRLSFAIDHIVSALFLLKLSRKIFTLLSFQMDDAVGDDSAAAAEATGICGARRHLYEPSSFTHLQL